MSSLKAFVWRDAGETLMISESSYFFLRLLGLVDENTDEADIRFSMEHKRDINETLHETFSRPELFEFSERVSADQHWNT
jgi:hypothetical protein